MQKLIYFLKQIYVPAIFVILEIAALMFYATASPYSQSRLMSINHYITGWSSNIFLQMRGYFHLREDNAMPIERIAELENRLNAYQSQLPKDIEIGVDLQSHQYITGKVVSNSLNRPQNYLVIDKGINDNVRIGMSVLSPEGYAVGYITNCSQNFSVALSILNTSFNVSSRLSKDRSMGLVSWSGGSPHMAKFTDVSKYASISVGDSVEAIDFSEYFPSGTIIGTILLLLILLLKDKGQGMGLLGSYLASRLSGKKHQQSCKLLDDSNDDDKSLSSVVLSLILLLKIAMCFVIIKNNCEYMLLPLLMVNYCTQGLLAGNRRINNNVLFYLELHDLDNFYIASAILLFVGVHLNFVVWLFTLFVFAMQYLFAARFTEDSNLYTGNKLTFSGEVSEFVLLIIFSLYLL